MMQLKRVGDMSAEIGGALVIVVDDAAKDITALDRASVLGLAVWDRGALVNALMRASNVVITVGELAQHPLQMGIIENEEVIEAFLSGGANPAFREGIRIRSPKGCGENVKALADEDGIESIRVLARKVQKHHLMLKNPLDDVFAPYGIWQDRR
jgi:hypothetical protein